MRPVRYLKVTTVDAAVAATRAAPDAAFVAGGTSLLDLMKLDVLEPAELVDVNALPLGKIEVAHDGLHVGALVRNSDLARHPDVVARYPLLSEALLAGASPQLRNMATVGGNLLQRTRCSYFRDPATPCNKRAPGAGCGALDGYNRMHAVLGTSDKCIAAHPSDMCVALLALDAVVHTRGPAGPRQIPIADFHILPGEHPERESVLAQGELVTGVSLPARPGFEQSRYLKVRDRASYAFALVSVGAALRIEDGLVREARIALGGVGTKPWRAVEAERLLVGQRPERAAFTRAAEAALAGAKPRKHNAFKVPLARRAIVRALATVKGAA
ncbi:MAG TPA: xanthine dehydrogenase family protein subunit M [Polyangia bacterium]|nr:xanthine dehydrogenase family protein subunit M [Polyangia bacterium]